jgi:tetratricopeptide (TPR) repeat protein
MELTIEQALQQGVAAHKEGKLQDAERLYRAILQSQPLHPDANHNLGVLAVSVNKADAALPLFKTALEANPKIEQFWVSYIDALVKAKHLKDAKQAIKKAKKKGFNAKKLQALLSQSKGTVDTKVPSEEQLTSLLEHYQNRRLSDAETLAISITQDFPKHQFAWKVLGAVLGATDRNLEAVDANQTAVALSPQDAEAHSNLGNTLKELGRLDEALASYTQAITLKPDYAEARQTETKSFEPNRLSLDIRSPPFQFVAMMGMSLGTKSSPVTRFLRDDDAEGLAVGKYDHHLSIHDTQTYPSFFIASCPIYAEGGHHACRCCYCP